MDTLFEPLGIKTEDRQEVLTNDSSENFIIISGRINPMEFESGPKWAVLKANDDTKVDGLTKSGRLFEMYGLLNLTVF